MCRSRDVFIENAPYLNIINPNVNAPIRIIQFVFDHYSGSLPSCFIEGDLNLDGIKKSEHRILVLPVKEVNLQFNDSAFE